MKRWKRDHGDDGRAANKNDIDLIDQQNGQSNRKKLALNRKEKKKKTREKKSFSSNKYMQRK